MRRVVTFSCGLASLFLAGPVHAHSGSLVWGGWKGTWEVKDNAGLALRGLYFNNELVAYKMSMPAIRVRYDHGVTYLDRIHWGNLAKISDCGSKKVCQRSFSVDGRNWLEILVLARIGKYWLDQSYYLSHDGWIYAELASRGLHHKVDHDHHVYWRFDFYINQNPIEEITRYDGLTITAYKYLKEFNDKKNPLTNRTWVVRDPAGGHGVSVMRSIWGDGTADDWSTLDVGGRLYKDSEDVPWKFGLGELGYNEGEDIQGRDTVFWYVGHLHHEQEEGPHQWHKTGPRLFLKR